MTTTFEQRKLSSLILLAKLEDEELFGLIEQLLTSGESKDWADELSNQDKLDITDGIKDIEENRVQDFEIFKKNTNTLFK